MKINSHLTTRRFRPLLSLLAGAMGLLASCVVSEEDRMMRKDAPTNEIQMNFVVSRAGLQQIDGVRMTPNILLMTQQQATDFDNPPADYLNSDDAYTHLVEVLGKINDYYKMTYNTGVEYASNGETYFARGYAPAVVLAPRETDRGAFDYRELTLSSEAVSGGKLPLGRMDFLSLDADPAYWGNKEDKFGQERNRLYFRHLTAQVLFVAQRDQSMVDMQYVRDVVLSNLRVCYYGGTDTAPPATDAGWMPFSVPHKLNWLPDQATAQDQTSSIHGYKVTEMQDLPDDFSIRTTGHTQLTVGRDVAVDSLFVNVRTSRTAATDIVNTPAGKGVFLKMDVSALLSHLDNFPMDTQRTNEENGLTHTMQWKDVIVPVHVVGTTNPVKSIETGKRYKITLVFGRHNLYLDAVLMEWKDGGVHDYVFRPGSNEVGS